MRQVLNREVKNNHMRTCKVMPDTKICRKCLDNQLTNNVVMYCHKCEIKNKLYEMTDVKDNLFGYYGIVLYNGKLKKVPFRRIFDVREE